MRKIRMTPFRAGLAAILVAFIAVYVAFGGALPWESPYQLRAVVASGSELHSRTPVRIAGVDVGKVADVKRGPGNLATVTLNLNDNALPIHSDATLKVRPRIFLEGNFFVDLQPGTPSAPTVKSGYTVPISQTAVPVQLDNVLTALQRGTRDDLVSLVHELAQALGRGGDRAFAGSIKQSGPLFREGAIAAEALRGQQQHDLSGTISNSERVARALASKQTQLASLVTGFSRTVQAFAARRTELSASLPELAGATREANPTFVALNGLFPTARAFVREARPGLRAAPATLRLANPLLAQLQGLLSARELPALIRVGDPAIRALARLQPHLRDLTGQLYAVTECLRRNVLPVAKSPIDDPPLSNGNPVIAELFHGWVGLASAYQNFDGNGHAVRYHAGFGDQSITTGKVPGLVEPLVGLTSEPLIGSRPLKPAGFPPIVADKPCMDQKRVDLHAQTGPAEPTKAVP